MKMELSRDSRQSREGGQQVHGAVTVFLLAFRSSGGTVSAWPSQTSLILAALTQGTVLSHNWAQGTLKPPENPYTDRAGNPAAVCPDVKEIFVSSQSLKSVTFIDKSVVEM